MGPAIGGSLVMALGIAITPLAITAALFLLGTPRGRTNGPAFVTGWVIGLLILGAIALVIFGSTGASRSGMPTRWTSGFKIVLGVMLVVVGVYELRTGGMSGTAAGGTRWSERFPNVKPPIALVLGSALAAARPKNILLVVAGSAVIAGTGITAKQQGIAYAVFAAVATIGVAVPVVIYFMMGDRAPDILRHLEEWMVRHAATIMSVVCLVIGVDLIGVGIAGLT